MYYFFEEIVLPGRSMRTCVGSEKWVRVCLLAGTFKCGGLRQKKKIRSLNQHMGNKESETRETLVLMKWYAYFIHLTL